MLSEKLYKCRKGILRSYSSAPDPEKWQKDSKRTRANEQWLEENTAKWILLHQEKLLADQSLHPSQ
jgi:hypothetical protein